MNGSLEKLLDEGMSVLVLILALTAFFAINVEFNRYQNSVSQTRRVMAQSNSQTSRQSRVYGSDVIVSFLAGEVDIRLYDSARPANLVLSSDSDITLSDLSMINLSDSYKVNYEIADSQVIIINYVKE